MQYLLLIYADEKIWANMSESEINKTMQAYTAFSNELAASFIQVHSASPGI